MNILPNDIKRRRAFIAEMCLLKEMSENEVECLLNKAEQGSRAFWEAVRSVCGERTGEYILKIAEKSAGQVEAGLTQMDGHGYDPKQADPGFAMLQWYMVGVCARELAKHENLKLHSRVNGCVERALACMAIIAPIASSPAQ